MLENEACLEKLLDNIFDFTLTTNENNTLAERSGERTTTLLKWNKILNGLTKTMMNTVNASGDNPFTKTSLYGPSRKLYQADTQSTLMLKPKITRRYNLRNRPSCSNNSRESSSDKIPQSLYHINKSHAQH